MLSLREVTLPGVATFYHQTLGEKEEGRKGECASTKAFMNLIPRRLTKAERREIIDKVKDSYPKGGDKALDFALTLAIIKVFDYKKGPRGKRDIPVMHLAIPNTKKTACGLEGVEDSLCRLNDIIKDNG